MPFDSTGFVRNLDATVRALGIDPIPQAVLADYKQQQVARHPGSWWYHHQTLGRGLIFCLSLAATVFGGTCTLFFLATESVGYLLGVLAAFVVLAGMVASGALSYRGLAVKGPASWVEHDVMLRVSSDRIPPAIWNRAVRIVQRLPGARLTLGDLQQDTVSLDPYLLVEYGAETVVLGVWGRARGPHGGA